MLQSLKYNEDILDPEAYALQMQMQKFSLSALV